MRFSTAKLKKLRLWWPALIILALFLYDRSLKPEPDAFPNLEHYIKRILWLSCITFSLIFLMVRWRKIKYLGTFTIYISMVLILLCAVEGSFMTMAFSSVLYPERSGPVSAEEAVPTGQPVFEARTDPTLYHEYDFDYGFRNLKNDTVQVRITVNGEEQPKAYYVLDGFRRRINRKDSLEMGQYFAIFLGCSITFGQHVQEDKTLPAQFQMRNPGVKSYNYGISASGPHQYLAILRHSNLREQIAEKSGRVFYTYFDGHTARAIGDYYSNQWNEFTPYYFLSGDSLFRDGNFSSGRPFRSSLFHFLRKSYFVQAIHFNYPRELRKEDFELTGVIIQAMKGEIQKQLGDVRFTVLLLPESGEGIKAELKKRGIEYIDYNLIKEHSGEDNLVFPIDNHPRAKLYGILADSLTKDAGF